MRTTEQNRLAAEEYARRCKIDGDRGKPDRRPSAVVDLLRKFIVDRNIRTIVDVPCGRFDAYMGHAIDGLFVNYLGLDILSERIERNRERFGSESILFAVHDIVADPVIPDCDLVVCRDFFQHLLTRDAVRVLDSVISRAKYVASTNHAVRENVELRVHPDCKLWGFRPVNLTLPPYEMHAPLVSVHEFGIKHFAIYETK